MLPIIILLGADTGFFKGEGEGGWYLKATDWINGAHLQNAAIWGLEPNWKLLQQKNYNECLSLFLE